MTRHHAHTGDRLVMVLFGLVAVVCGIATWGIAIFGGA
jgi:hypothetical protein